MCVLCSDMLLDDTGGDGGMRKEGRHVKVVVSLDEDRKWTEVRGQERVEDGTPSPDQQLPSATLQADLGMTSPGSGSDLQTLPCSPQDGRVRHFLIGCIGVSGKTKWDVLDGVVRRLFKVQEKGGTFSFFFF